ncbi:MAG: hypothetical protein QNJ02_07480 [Desulfobacterales bacterium]|nr:hypothetical protein [Desulfobacterales bacterium]MDJ0875095.1 hypothetical protein [Desulfobacterales bacterium]
MGTNAVGRRCLVVKPPAVNNFTDNHSIEAPGLVAGLSTYRVGAFAAGRGKGISRQRSASPGLDGYERSDAQGFFAHEIETVLTYILYKSQIAWRLVKKTKADDRTLILPVMFSLIPIGHVLSFHSLKLVRFKLYNEHFL